jgi:tripartite-type tricarboxylate transporter receptor subunit TctC
LGPAPAGGALKTEETKVRLNTALLGLMAALSVAGPAAAEFPDRPIRVVVPFAPGGNTDVTGRLVADKLREVLGTTVLVENKPGASGMIGMDAVARAAPDGYTLLVSANSMVIVPAIYGNAPYDWKTAFQPISLIQSVPGIIVVAANSPIKTFAEFIKAGRDSPGRIAVADSGVGTTNHLCLELLSEATGAKYTQVHYKGSGGAVSDVVGGQVAAQIDQVNSAIGYIKGGKLRALAVSSAQRLPELPDVPTMKESGVAGLGDFTFSTYIGLFGPAKMPPAVLARLHDAMVKVLVDPGVVKRFAELSAETKSSTPEEFAAMLHREDETVVPLIKKLGIKPE